MKKSLRWKWLLIGTVTAVLVLASIPLTERDVVEFIRREAVGQDEDFEGLVGFMEEERDQPGVAVLGSDVDIMRAYLAETGLDLTRYFPDRGDDNDEVINYIVRRTRGRINLGLDLQGGMHIILEVDELELIQRVAEGIDEDFRELMADVRRISADSPRRPVEILREEARRRGIDLLAYYRDYYERKYGLTEEGGDRIETEADLFEYFEHDIRAANIGSLDILRTRLDGFGVAEPDIQQQGVSELLVQLPGVRDAEGVLNLIRRQAYMEFKLVDDDPDRLRRALDEGQAPPGFELKTYRMEDERGRVTEEPLLLRERAELLGENLRFATPSKHPVRPEFSVRFELDAVGSRIFSRVTRQYNAEDNPPGRRLAIVLDGNVISAPVIRSHIPRGEGVIEGRFTLEQARLLASQLTAGAYPAPLQVREQRMVGPTLGRDSIESGIRAAVYGMVAVVVFLAAYYYLAGVVADFALCLNLVFIIGTLCALPALFTDFRATLTLPGIAGIILTIGIAVDANVLIFERIREELAAGKRIRMAIGNGFDKALVTILDANITTLIAALVLLNPLDLNFLPTAGPIRGFALTLTVGIATSMFAALVVTRSVFDLMLLSPRFKTLKMASLFHHPGINFLGKSGIALIVSGVLIVASLTSFWQRGEENFGIDFTGGILLQRQFTQPVDLELLREALAEAGAEAASIQLYGADQGVIIRSGVAEADKIDAAIAARFEDSIDPADYELRTEMVGPRVGRRLRVQALGAVILALLATMVYIWFRFSEFRFALGAALALLHDVLITVGFLTGFFIFAPREFNIPVIAALLTIVGYSLNDTIVLFVRIRENLKAYRGSTLSEIVNRSINEVLGRTMLTSLTTLMVLVFLFFLGGEVINNFAFALMVGVVVGTYSSIFIASPVLLLWQKKTDSRRKAARG